MFCPQCSQQQLSNEVRFCPRCGFPLSGVSQLIANGGNLLGSSTEAKNPKRSPRSDGYRQGVLVIFVCFILLPIAEVLGKPYEQIPLVFLMAGFMRMLYAKFFQEGSPKQAENPVL